MHNLWQKASQRRKKLPKIGNKLEINFLYFRKDLDVPQVILSDGMVQGDLDLLF
jgi:hypothetical protein